MLKQRVVTAVVLLAVILAAAVAGRLALDAVLALLLGAAAFEWLRLAQHSAPIAVAVAAVLAAGLLAVQTALPSVAAAVAPWFIGVAALLWLLIAGFVVRRAHRGGCLRQALSTALALLLLTAAWLAAMRILDEGVDYFLSVLAIVWLADIAAFFVGRRSGRRKLAPAISPGKTWAGVGGAVVAVLAAALLLAQLAPQAPLFTTLLQLRLGIAAAGVVLVGLIALSVIGDLFESLLKRQAQVKDSGQLLPGHGGVLDRLDALLAVLPAAALLDLWLRR